MLRTEVCTGNERGIVQEAEEAILVLLHLLRRMLARNRFSRDDVMNLKAFHWRREDVCGFLGSIKEAGGG